jgi:hypothetical protein
VSWKVSPARVIAFTPKNIKACFAVSGLFPFNLERVLRSMPNPAELAIPRADEVKVGSCRQDVELQTPVTPVSAEAFMWLQNLIIQRGARALDETSKQNLARHLQKCAKASKNSLLGASSKKTEFNSWPQSTTLEGRLYSPGWERFVLFMGQVREI